LRRQPKHRSRGTPTSANEITRAARSHGASFYKAMHDAIFYVKIQL